MTQAFRPFKPVPLVESMSRHHRNAVIALNLVCLAMGALLMVMLACLPDENFVLSEFQGGYIWQAATVLSVYAMAWAVWHLVRAVIED